MFYFFFFAEKIDDAPGDVCELGSGAVALLAGSFLGVIDFPVGLSVEAMPQDKVDALAWFVLALVTLAGGAMAWLVSTFRIDRDKVDALRTAPAEGAA